MLIRCGGELKEVLNRESEINVELAVAAPKISMLKRSEIGRNELKAVLSIGLTKLAVSIGLDITSAESGQAAQSFIEDLLKIRWYLSVEDVLLFFKNARTGRYGKIFGRNDWQVLNLWLNKYEMEDRADAILKNNHNLMLEQEESRGLTFDQLPKETQNEINKALGLHEYDKEEQRQKEYEQFKMQFIEEKNKKRVVYTGKKVGGLTEGAPYEVYEEIIGGYIVWNDDMQKCFIVRSKTEKI